MTDAPYGTNLDGSVKKSRRGRPRGSATAKPSGPAGPRPRAPRAASSSTPRARKGGYKDGLKGILHLLAVPLLPTAPLDAAAIMSSADEIATALDVTAQHRPEIRAMCEKIMTAGPYGMLIAALIKPVAQIAQNHGWIPPQMASSFGAVPPEVLRGQLMAMMQQPAEQPPAPQPQTNNGFVHAAPVG